MTVAEKIGQTARYAALTSTLALGLAAGCTSALQEGSTSATPSAESQTDSQRDGSFLDEARDRGMSDDDPRTRGILTLANEASFEKLDASDEVGLDVRAARNIVDTRRTDGPFETLQDLDAVDWVSDRAFGKLYEYSMNNGYVDNESDDDASDDDSSRSTVHGVVTDSPRAEGILKIANRADEQTLDRSEKVGLDARAAANIVDYRRGADGRPGTSNDRTFAGLGELAEIDYVADRAFGKLLDWAEKQGYVDGESESERPVPKPNQVTIDRSGSHPTLVAEGPLAEDIIRLFDRAYEEGTDNIADLDCQTDGTPSCHIGVGEAEFETDSTGTLLSFDEGRDGAYTSATAHFYEAVEYLGSFGGYQTGHVSGRFTCSNGQSPSPYVSGSHYSCHIGAQRVVTLEDDDGALPALGDDRIWEGWLIVDGEPVTTGHFRAEKGGNQYHFRVPAETAAAAQKFVVTIEPADEPEATPSKQKYLAGPVGDGVGTITTTRGPTLAGADLSNAAGQFFLAAPSGRNNDETDYRNGIWFIDNSGGTKSAGLDLPELGEGWTYEGWVVKEGVGPVSTGRFDDPAEADSDMGGPFAGPAGTPPFPGQDFVMPDGRRDLTSGYKTVISVEPQPDNSPKPFAPKPLAGAIDDTGKGALQSLTSKDLPTATVTIR